MCCGAGWGLLGEDLSSPNPLVPGRFQSSGQEQSVTFCAYLPVGTPGHLSDLNPAGLCVGASPRNKRTKSCPMRVGGKILGSLKMEINMGNLPAGPMAKMPHSQCRGPGFIPWVGKIP